jgi:cardiolipin synthase
VTPDGSSTTEVVTTPPARRLTPVTERRAGAGKWSWPQIERATGGPTIPGNDLKLHFEGPNTFGAWLDDIRRAARFVYFENYLVRDDEVGRQLRDAMIAKAQEGVPVYVIYDWLGCWATPRSFWKPLVQAGVHVRTFNRPGLRLGDPFGAVQRDHRKLLVVDGESAHVGGMCVGVEWAGTRTEAPWRDTGLAIRGPAAHAAAQAFERVWSERHEPLGLSATVPVPGHAGDTPVWLIEGEPGRARVYRTLHLNASRATDSIWMTDAYFVAPRSVSEALGAAAQQGVDVRLLVPAHNNWPIVGSMSRGGYRFLLESGVRIFEWQGPMIHAKTAVVDGMWCRVGSSNLNTASLMGNWELDVGVLDDSLARQMQGLFLADLASSVEIVLPGTKARRRSRKFTFASPTTASLEPEGSLHERIEQRPRGHAQGRLTLAALVRAREALGAALAGNRRLGREDRTMLGLLSFAILVIAVVAAILPTLTGWVVAINAGWLALSTGARAYLQARRGRREEREAAERDEGAAQESQRDL